MNQTASVDVQPFGLRGGMRLPPFVKGGITPLSAPQINPLVSIWNALMNLQVVRSQAQPSADGDVIAYGEVKWSDNNVILHLYDAN
jgi:hypothetical protein